MLSLSLSSFINASKPSQAGETTYKKDDIPTFDGSTSAHDPMPSFTPTPYEKMVYQDIQSNQPTSTPVPQPTDTPMPQKMTYQEKDAECRIVANKIAYEFGQGSYDWSYNDCIDKLSPY